MNQSDQNKVSVKERPPVVAVMGHIDHGKSRLLDTIRKTNIVDNEAGGITQHIGAYEVIHKDKTGRDRKITFLDTPGHEAFAGIRSRGVEVADIGILVVSAEEGVKPQTLEAYKYIKAAGIPMIVAINKIDKPTADVERTKQNLAENEIYLEGYGGDVPFTPISAKFGQGVDDLLDLMLIVADLAELKGQSDAHAEGAVIESHRDPKKGITATVILKNGTLHSGECVVAGDSFSPVRIMEDFQGNKVKIATFSSPVVIVGWNKVPDMGVPIKVCATKKEAEELATRSRAVVQTHAVAPKKQEVETVDETGPKEVIVPLVIKADATGSLEAIEHEIKKIVAENLKLKIVSKSVGDINEGDIKAASCASNPLVLGFNVAIDPQANQAAERMGIKIETFEVIYKLVEWLQAVAAERRPRITVEEMIGRAKVLKLFSKVRDDQIIGGRADDGVLKVGAEIKILRRDAEIGRGRIKGLQQSKVKTDEVKKGVEFGALIDSKNEIAPGDYIEAFSLVLK